ncbi:MAG TPA: D-alanyl-D-alanine carboxypeptidase, partial [Pyrinomonadaceae bacterium]|nr:D-alanyl-D-alanine carboxypeptidase [Pyrinomonadaceae bacterium]
KPLLQQITVHKDAPAETSSTQLIKKTGSSSPSAAYPQPIAARAIKTAIPVLADAAIPGNSGVLVETLDGNVVVESGSDQTYNPASNVKIATSFAVLKTFGPDYRFPTNFWTDGTFDATTGTLNGNLYVSGRDPMFGYEHAVAAASALNRLGIRSVTGDLIVTDNFAMNFSTAAARSSQTLFSTLDAAKRSAAANRVWTNYLINSGKLTQSSGIPSVSFTGGVYVQSMPSNVKLLFSHESAPMREIVKTTMCYSNNFLAERLGDMLGGPYAVARIVQQSIGVQPSEFYLATSSGLGINRVTPSAMMKLLRTFRGELARNRMTFADVMPVAGVDKGTLENRFDTDFSTGSVIGKTGTLGNTDGGVSALAGEINTRGGTLLFVIFNQRGNVARFRSFQNNYVSLIQGQFGGPAPIAYQPVSLDTRLTRTRITYPNNRSYGN